MILQKHIKNKSGSITVEAVISVAVMILVLTSMFQLLTLYPEEEVTLHKTYDALNQLDNAYYLYHKVGVYDFDYDTGHQILDQLIDDTKNVLDQSTAELMLKSYLQALLNEEEIQVIDLSLDGDILRGQLTYPRSINLGYEWQMTIDFEKRLWLFGNEKTLFPNHTLVEKLQSSQDKEKHIVVYQTKTGEKYHYEGCFYLTRSTTDKENIISMTLYEAKRIKHLSPCKRCIGGD